MTLTRLEYSQDAPQFPGQKPLLFTGFSDEGISGRDGEGRMNTVTGLYAALSFDEGKTWPEEFRRVISNLQVSETWEVEVAAWQRTQTLTKTAGQENGYMSVVQSPDGLIYLTDGKLLYTFNLAWLLEGARTSTQDPVSCGGSFSLYPNPSEGNLTMELENGYFGPVRVTLYSSEGKTLESYSCEKKETEFRKTLTFNALSGAYFVKLVAGLETFERRIVMNQLP